MGILASVCFLAMLSEVGNGNENESARIIGKEIIMDC